MLRFSDKIKMVNNWKRTLLQDDNEQHMYHRRIFYAKKQISRCHFYIDYGKYYGLRNGRIQHCKKYGQSDQYDLFHALAELPLMVPIAFILEFFIVGKLAHQLAFMVVRPSDRAQIITYAISICICCIMCPIMSFIACLLFNRNQMSFAFWIKTWALNFPVAILYQLFYCGPLVRLIFRIIFSKKEQSTNF